jgi:hypothetical protein
MKLILKPAKNGTAPRTAARLKAHPQAASHQARVIPLHRALLPDQLHQNSHQEQPCRKSVCAAIIAEN